jgi:hypothetical protein
MAFSCLVELRLLITVSLMFAGFTMTRTVIAAATTTQFSGRSELGMSMRETIRDELDDDESDK